MFLVPNQKSIDCLFLGNSTRIDHKIKIIWILIKLHKSDFSIKLSDLLDSNLSSKTIVTVVLSFGKTKQLHKMTPIFTWQIKKVVVYEYNSQLYKIKVIIYNLCSGELSLSVQRKIQCVSIFLI